MALRRSLRRFNLRNTNRYTDGSGRTLDPGEGQSTDLYLPPINDPKRANAYPARTGHWQPVIRGEPSPYKGNIVVVGAGIVGSTVASMFALRGWHVTVVEQQEADCAKMMGLETVLLTKRALDVLHSAGVRKEQLAQIGTKVTGLTEHPGTVASWLSQGLSEHNEFAVNMLAIDVKSLRQMLTRNLQAIPHRNAKTFHQHKLVAVIPGARAAVVKPLFEEIKSEDGVANTKAKEVVIGGRKFEDNVEGLTYDVLVGADGLDSALRRFLDINGEVRQHEHFATKWFTVTGATHLNCECIQRWCHRFHRDIDPERSLGVVTAYPRGHEGTFNVQCYMPTALLENRTVQELVDECCPELKPCTVLDGVESPIKPAPTLFLPDFCPQGAFPEIALVGDAASHRNPILMENFGCALEDCAALVNNVDSIGKSMWDCVRQYSRERGMETDALRIITERSVYYAKARHYDPLLRFRNTYTHMMHYLVPRGIQEHYQTVGNYFYPRSLEQMLHGRGYASYSSIDHSQFRANRWWCFTRLFT